MEMNPYESPRSPPGPKMERRGIRFLTVVVLAMLSLLAATCLVLGLLAYWLQRRA